MSGSWKVEVAQDLIFIVIPATADYKFERGDKAVKVLVTALLDGYKAFLETNSGGKALAIGVISGAASIAADGLWTTAAKDALNHAVVPVAAKFVAGAVEVLPDVPAEVAKKVTEEVFKLTGKATLRRITTPPHESHRHEHRSVADSITYWDDLLVKLAIVDMEKGIGRSGW